MISNKTYDVLKWLALLFLPSVSVFIGSVIKVSTDKFNRIDE